MKSNEIAYNLRTLSRLSFQRKRESTDEIFGYLTLAAHRKRRKGLILSDGRNIHNISYSFLFIYNSFIIFNISMLNTNTVRYDSCLVKYR